MAECLSPLKQKLFFVEKTGMCSPYERQRRRFVWPIIFNDSEKEIRRRLIFTRPIRFNSHLIQLGKSPRGVIVEGWERVPGKPLPSRLFHYNEKDDTLSSLPDGLGRKTLIEPGEGIATLLDGNEKLLLWVLALDIMY